MTVIQPNSVSGINSITVQNGNSLAIHKADGSLIRTITGATGVTTFATASVGAAWTDFSQGGGLNIGLGASISNGSGNVLTFGTNGDDRATITSGGDVTIGNSSVAFPSGGGLQVYNASAPRIKLTNSTTGVASGDGFQIYVSGSAAYLDQKENAEMRFYTNGTERSRIDSSGRLLVGHTASEAMYYTGRIQVQGTTSATSAITVKTNQNDSGGPALVLGKSRGSVGSATVVQNNDELGAIYFNGADGTDAISRGAAIRCHVDGTPGGNDMPGRLQFYTTPDGAAAAVERMRLDSLGNVLIGNLATASASRTGVLVVETNNYNGIQIVRNSADASTPLLSLSKSRGTSSGAVTVVNNGDICGRIRFQGADGDELSDAAYIDCKIDAAPGNNDMAGRLIFYTSADGSSSPTSRLEINKDGYVYVKTGDLDVESGTVSDAKGDVRKSYKNEQASTYTLVAADASKVIGAQNTITIPASVFGNGDMVSIVNMSGGNITLTQGSGLTLYNTGDASTGNRTLATRGMATVWFPAGTTAYISGTGLS